MIIANRYRVTARIGRGGMGVVYRALDESSPDGGPEVAVKVLSDAGSDAMAEQLFLSEAKVAAQLDHPNIVRVIDLGRHGSDLYLVMDYLEGCDARRLLTAADDKEQPLGTDACVYIVAELCAGLEYAHELSSSSGEKLNLVHRDVSPENCLIGAQGQVKLTDFGIAKTTGARRTETGIVRGKVGYLSPEQTCGDTLDRRSDVFAAGVVLYELLTGVRPFNLDDDNELNTIERIRSGSRKRASELRDLPADLDEVVERALATDRRSRYQTAGAFRGALMRTAAGRAGFAAADLAALAGRLVTGAEAAETQTHTGPAARSQIETRPEGLPAHLKPTAVDKTAAREATQKQTPHAATDLVEQPLPPASMIERIGLRGAAIILSLAAGVGLGIGWWLGRL